MVGSLADGCGESEGARCGGEPRFGPEFIEPSMALLQIGVYQVDEVFGQFGGDLFFGAVGEVEADVGFEDFAHEGVDAAADGGKQHELAAAIFVGGERSLDGIELAADFAEPLQQLEFLAILMGHDMSPCLDYTHGGYCINPVGV